MATCLVVPVGIVKEAVESAVGREVVKDISSIVAVTVPGFEMEKKQVIAALELLSRLAGVQLYVATIRPGSAEDVAELYRTLRSLEYDRVVLVGTTGSRYLFPVLFMILLQIWRERGVEVYLLHGVEGEGLSLENLAGFAAPVLRVSSVQKRLLRAIYSSPDAELEVQELMRELKLGRSAYYALQDLGRKGLVKYRWGRVGRTFAGEVFYRVVVCGGEAGGC